MLMSVTLSLWFICGLSILCFQADLQLKEATLQQDDSDLEKKRREAEALLQSVGIITDVPAGMFNIACGSSDQIQLIIIR